MVNALEAGTIVAVMAGVVGWFMVLRRQTFAGHTLSVMAFPGAAGALLLGLSAAVGYFVFCGAGALVIGAAAAGTRRAPRRGVGGDRHRAGVRAGAAGSCSSASTRASSPTTRTCCSATSSGITRGQVLTLAIVVRARARRSSRSSAGRCCSPRSTSRWRAPAASRSARCSLGFLLAARAGGRRDRADHRRAARVRAARRAAGDRAADHAPHRRSASSLTRRSSAC